MNFYKKDGGLSEVVLYVSILIASLIIIGKLLFIDNNYKVITKEVVVPINTNVIMPVDIGRNLQRVNYSEEDLYYLTEAIYFESRGESMDCQAQVGYVILNRVQKRNSSIKEIIYQPYQFSYTKDGKHERMTDEDSRQVAQSIATLVLNGYAKDFTRGATHYYNPSMVDWRFKDDYEYVMTCGMHDFHE